MKLSVTKLAALGLIALSSAASAGPVMNTARDAKNGSLDFASATWRETKRVANTIVDSPAIAYHVIRGDRPLFPSETASRDRENRRQQVALTGHHVKKSPDQSNSVNHSQPPPI